MQQFHNILFVSHGINNEIEVLKQTIKLSVDNQAKLSVLIICPVFPDRLKNYLSAYKESLIENMNQLLNKAKSELDLEEKKLEITINLEIDSTPDIRIIRHVLRHDYDLLIKEVDVDERAPKGFKALDMQLLHKCPCALFLYRASKHNYKKLEIAVAVDPLEEEPCAHDLAIRLLHVSDNLASRYTGKLNIISCWNVGLETIARNNPWLKIAKNEMEGFIKEEKNAHKDALERLIKASNITDSYKIQQIKGRAEDLIPKEIENKKIDVLVMGTVARTGISGFIIGNTAENILQKIDCSLLALKPPGFISPVKAY